MDLNSECNGGDGFIDRSKVRILLCDNDSKSLKEGFTLLTECSYQVTSVRSARQVIDALNAERADIDIILAEVDLPMSKGMKMLKYITRDKDLRRIPVIMMSRQDKVSVVVKCLKLGAADYLVKPLRTNELLNLWTHMWRRRRMLGLSEKNILSYDFDLVGSDPSDANTNSTNLFSDDTDDKSLRCTNLQTLTSKNPENECSIAAISASDHAGDGCGAADGTVTSPPAVAAMEPPSTHPAGSHPYEPAERDTNEGQFSFGPKKSKLKIGESSAFFTYVKSTVLKANCQDCSQVNEYGSNHHCVEEKKLRAADESTTNTNQTCSSRETQENYSQGDDFHSGTSFLDSLERSCTPPMSMEFRNRSYGEGKRNASRGPMETGMQAQYGHQLPLHCPPNHPNGMSRFPYYHPMGVSLQHGQMSLQHGQMPVVHHPWPTEGNVSSNEVKLNKVDRREEALIKFRRKRNQRCFDKKIRYVNRKRLAERRPRVRGQFVRKVNGVNVDLNGQPASAEYDDEDEDEEEEEGRDLSPQDKPLET
ncbi:PREDICTED: two-component response regulator-like APRR1 isoform X2 [Tarenaya hassleriana]|uniref:two-component response regulator-like APRR1 isoform X2 n=1 Tax=Tarenaya hassleriana TaxID=28532 RepID=UPI00053C325D|nr:PREDICTED: two-component response regulator-like APRR1 isoform X2 [Tarenaya hassleriana]